MSRSSNDDVFHSMCNAMGEVERALGHLIDDNGNSVIDTAEGGLDNYHVVASFLVASKALLHNAMDIVQEDKENGLRAVS